MNTDTAPTDTNEIGPPTSEPAAEPANYFEDIVPPAPPPTADPEKPRRATSRTWPIRPMHCRDGGLFPVKDAPEFAEAREANAWIAANTPAGETFMPVRHPEKAFRQTLKLEEVSPW